MGQLSAKLRSVDLGNATGVAFWCPGCKERHIIATAGKDGYRGPIWGFDGNVDAPTFSPSILVTCDWGDPPEREVCHSFVRGGRIEFLGDCTHHMPGQTVDLPDLPA